MMPGDDMITITLDRILAITTQLTVLATVILAIINRIKTKEHLEAQDVAIAKVQESVVGQKEALVEVSRENAGALADAVAQVVKKDTQLASQVSAAEIARLHDKIETIVGRVEPYVRSEGIAVPAPERPGV
jgi:hypothetical protein